MTREQEFQHFQQLHRLLQLEKEADYRTFLELVREKPLSDRVEQGYTWYPLQVLNTGFALGEKAFIVVEELRLIERVFYQLRKLLGGAGMPSGTVS